MKTNSPSAILSDECRAIFDGPDYWVRSQVLHRNSQPT